MAIADPLSRLARQEHQLDTLDLPLMLEMLLKELPSTVRNALNIRVNAEKDTIVATRIVQRWRKPSNPISNTVGTISDKIDFLISAPYADKLPLINGRRTHPKGFSVRSLTTIIVVKRN